MYKYLPESKTIISLLSPRSHLEQDKLFKWCKKSIFISSIFLGVLILFFEGLHLFPESNEYLSSHVTISNFGLRAAGVALIVLFLSALILVINAVIGIREIFYNPTAIAASDFDMKYNKELELLMQFRAIPPSVVLTRNARIEQEIQIKEKWLGLVNIFGLIGVPLVLVIKYFTSNSTVIYGAEVMTSALIVGAVLGGICLKTCIRDFQTLSIFLKRVAENNRKSGSRRR